jgi:hypothetical protein
MQLGGDGNRSQAVAAGEFGVPEDESRTQGEGDQENQDDRRQAVIGHRLPLTGGVPLLGAVPASVAPLLHRQEPAITFVEPGPKMRDAEIGGP